MQRPWSGKELGLSRNYLKTSKEVLEGGTFHAWLIISRFRVCCLRGRQCGTVVWGYVCYGKVTAVVMEMVWRALCEEKKEQCAGSCIHSHKETAACLACLLQKPEIPAGALWAPISLRPSAVISSLFSHICLASLRLWGHGDNRSVDSVICPPWALQPRDPRERGSAHGQFPEQREFA